MINGASFGSPFLSMVPDAVLKTMVTAAPHWGTSIPFKRVLCSAQSGPSRMAESFKRRAMSRKRKNSKKIGAPMLHCLNPNAAGVDVGATEIYRRACGSRSATGKAFLDVYRRPARRCGLVEGLQHRDGGDGIDGSLLDSVFSDPGGARFHCRAGQRAPREERAGAQIGCFRLSVAAISAFGRFAARIVPAGTGGLHGAFDPSSSGQPGADGFEPRPTHAKGSRSDEPATTPRSAISPV